MAGFLARVNEPLPRGLLVVGAPIAFLALTFFFIFLGFPYERLAGGLADRVEAGTGVRLQIGDLGPSLGLRGPGFTAEDVVAIPSGGDPIRLEHLKLRPAWSLSWFSGNPAIHVDAQGPLAAVKGAVTLGDARGFAGTLQAVDLGALPLDQWAPELQLDGTADAKVDLSLDERGPYGTLLLDAKDGSVSLPGSPVALPFQVLSGDFRFGGEQYALVDRLELEGPVLNARAEGSVGQARRLERAALDLQIQLDAREPVARTALQSLGVRLGRDGKGSLRLSGTIGNPRIR